MFWKINNKPPTLYSILNSIVNFEKEDKTKIINLSKEARSIIFNFEYPLSEKIDKEKFEEMILNKFMMRRINFDTVTAFQIQLNVKLNEIMPLYNKMFDSLEGWNIFEENSERIINEERTTSAENNLSNESNSSGLNTYDKRFSKTPQNELQNVRDGKYVSEYNYDTDTTSAQDFSESHGTSNGQDHNIKTEKYKKDINNKIEIYKEFQDNLKSIYSMIFNELEILFYGLL